MPVHFWRNQKPSCDDNFWERVCERKLVFSIRLVFVFLYLRFICLVFVILDLECIEYVS